MKTLRIGSIISGTMRPEDLIPTFADELESLDEDGILADLLEKAREIENYNDEGATDILDDLFTNLNEFAPPYFYFGSHPSDGSDYGFWLSETMPEEFDGLRVSDLSEIPDNYSGEVLHINDHGNMTLYSCNNGKLEEIWGIV